MLLSIITPTYNREYYLPRLYNSLQRQQCKEFEWIVVDDGSKDGTSRLFDEWKDEANFKITYIKKVNGGKHTALNIAFDECISDLIVIVDSDDYLTENAVSEIKSKWLEIKDCNDVCGMMYLRIKEIDEDGCEQSFGCHFKKEVYKEKLKKLQKRNLGEKVYVIKNQFMKRKKFPEYEAEKYVPESYIWRQLGMYNILAVDKAIYIGGYIPAGLTNSGRKLRLNSINGMIDAEVMSLLCKQISLKHLVLISSYFLYADKNQRKKIRERYPQIDVLCLLYPIGFIIKTYWKVRYK